jgi:hypothetical protein
MIGALMIAIFCQVGHTAPDLRSVASIREGFRVDHARELLGKHYKKSGVSRYEHSKLDLEKKVLAIVNTKLPKKFRAQWSKKLARAILDESFKHQLDPMFVAAVIEGESSFNPDTIGPVGEIGLMQVRPTTGAWLAKRLKKKWGGKNSLKNPVTNVVLGTAYMAWLRGQFEGQGQLYVAAYNMGPKNVRRALGKQIWPKDYPRHVMKRYLAFYQVDKTGPKKAKL